jgi:hypothetical protein
MGTKVSNICHKMQEYFVLITREIEEINVLNTVVTTVSPDQHYPRYMLCTAIKVCFGFWPQ